MTMLSYGVYSSKLNLIMSTKQYLPKRKILPIVLGVALMCGALYFVLLYYSPSLPSIPVISASAIDLDTRDDNTDMRNRIQIKRLNLEVPYYNGESDVLNKGAWHRYPQNGNPENGGNFVLAAHRFDLALTPNQTKQKSPFYHIEDLQDSDEIKVMYNGKWYTYEVNKKYEVPATALYIENRSNEPKLTLYSCSLEGATAGRYVIEARPIE